MKLSAPAYCRQACLPTPVPTAGGVGRCRVRYLADLPVNHTVGGSHV